MSEVGRFRLIDDVLWIGAVMSRLSKSEIDDLRKALTKWLPVTDHSTEPEIGKRVEVLSDNGFIEIARLERDKDTGMELWWIGDDNYKITDVITHWKELPERNNQ